MIKQIFVETDQLMKKSIERLRSEFAMLRTGRASIALVDGIKVEYYGSVMPINQVAGVTVPEPRTLEIKPWDPSVIPVIERAILSSNLGITPINDGKSIRLNMPALTQERRQELTKVIKKLAEDFRVAVRNVRRDSVESVRKALKEKTISEDEEKSALHEIQKLTDLSIAKIDEISAHKEKEILEI